MSQEKESDGLDIAGFGKIASAIPAKVYEQSATVLLTTFRELIAPFTEITSGFGRYLAQKFDNMVEAEKAIATYTVEKALARARTEAERKGRAVRPPAHPKSFVKAIEEASKETDPLLHEMWANLLASQLADDTCHPHFVEILPHFSSAEAKLLISLLPKSQVGAHDGGYLFIEADCLTHWVRKTGDELHPWTLSCDLLYEFRFADLLAPKGSPRLVTILYRTASGTAFFRQFHRRNAPLRSGVRGQHSAPQLLSCARHFGDMRVSLLASLALAGDTQFRTMGDNHCNSFSSTAVRFGTATISPSL